MRRPRPLSSPITLTMARARMRRRALTRWAATAAVIAVTTWLVLGLVHRADRAVAQWGEQVDVLVARRPLEPGRRLRVADVDIERWPVGLRPAGAIPSLDRGRTVTAPIAAGEPLVEHRLGPDGLSGGAALLPAGSRALAIPRTAAGLDLAVGDQVDLLASGYPLADEPAPEIGAATATAIATAATVLAVDDAAVTVAVAVEHLGTVVGALTTGTVTLALTSPAQPENPDAARPSTRTPNAIR